MSFRSPYRLPGSPPGTHWIGVDKVFPPCHPGLPFPSFALLGGALLALLKKLSKVNIFLGTPTRLEFRPGLPETFA